jgi:hypothetical protein
MSELSAARFIEKLVHFHQEWLEGIETESTIACVISAISSSAGHNREKRTRKRKIVM